MPPGPDRAAKRSGKTEIRKRRRAAQIQAQGAVRFSQDCHCDDDSLSLSPANLSRPLGSGPSFCAGSRSAPQLSRQREWKMSGSSDSEFENGNLKLLRVQYPNHGTGGEQDSDEDTEEGCCACVLEGLKKLAICCH